MKWKQLLLLSLLVLSFLSCKTVEQASQTYKNKIDTVYVAKYKTDSILIKDSIWIKEKADTVFVKEWHTKYLVDIQRDTLYQNHTDTCYVEKIETVHEKHIPSWVWWLLGATGLISLISIGILVIKIILKFK